MPFESPYLSIVAVSRNDNHGGKLLERMQHFIDCLNEQANLFQIPIELILVEWNPPTDRPSLEYALNWPKNRQYLLIRIITVPLEIHKRFKYSDALPLFQMIGKNVGIRRAKGRYILATNIDIIFSDELMEYISSRPFESGYFYRVDRIDVDPNIAENASLEQKLKYCRTHVIRINSRHFLSNCSNLKGLVIDVAKNPALLIFYLKSLMYKIKTPRLHYNACGDFTLMAKDDWENLRGYPELEMFSLHIDSLFLMAASFSGFLEKELYPPMEIYHIEHSIGSGITPGLGQKTLFQRLDKDHIPYLSWRECLNLALKLEEQINKNNRIIHCNDENWGLNEFSLPEKVLNMNGFFK